MPVQAFPRRRIKVTHPRHRFDADLVDLQDLASKNRGYKYILVVIDAFTKYVWARPSKTKQGEIIRTGLEDIFTNKTDGAVPQLMYTDAGKEFMASTVQTLFRNAGIVHRICGGEAYHCPFVERVNRTLKEKLFQAMTATTTQSWYDLLPKIVSTYNKTIHSTTLFAPITVSDKDTLDVYHNTYANNKSTKDTRKYKYKVGDYVRIAKAQEVFSRGYLPRFTWEIFKIVKLANVGNQKQPPAYILADFNDNIIEHAVFYEPELSLVDPQLVHGKRAIFPINQILKRRIVNGNQREILVWWKGWPKKEAEWIPESQLTTSKQKGI